MNEATIPKFDNFPEYLKEHGLFNLWKYEMKDGQLKKMPYNAKHTNRHGDPTDRNTFTSFESIVNFLKYCKSFSGVGVGIFDNIVGIDLDDCFNTDGTLTEEAAAFVEQLNTYTELSPSGTGLRLFAIRNGGFIFDAERWFVSKHEKGKRRGIEVYFSDKYCTITGNVYRNLPLRDISNELPELLDKYMLRNMDSTGNNSVKKDGSSHICGGASFITEEDIIKLAMAATNGDKFKRLWNGDSSGCDSPSEADYSFMCMLAFWCNNASMMQSLFERSGRYEDAKRRHPLIDDYIQRTISKALKKTDDVYTPAESVDGYRIGWKVNGKGKDGIRE